MSVFSDVTLQLPTDLPQIDDPKKQQKKLHSSDSTDLSWPSRAAPVQYNMTSTPRRTHVCPTITLNAQRHDRDPTAQRDTPPCHAKRVPAPAPAPPTSSLLGLRSNQHFLPYSPPFSSASSSSSLPLTFTHSPPSHISPHSFPQCLPQQRYASVSPRLSESQLPTRPCACVALVSAYV